jgi:hypothetical protein
MITLQPTEQRALLERFLRYVQVDTQSDENSKSGWKRRQKCSGGRSLVDDDILNNA